MRNSQKALSFASLIGALFLAAGPLTAEDRTDNSDTLVIVACRVDDWTGKRPLPEGTLETAPGWKDLELHENKDGELECKRELVDPKGHEHYTGILPANPDYSNTTKCARGAMMLAQGWNSKNEGWAVVGVGCPNPIYADDKKTIIGYMLPGCPRELNGKAIHCRFSEDAI